MKISLLLTFTVFLFIASSVGAQNSVVNRIEIDRLDEISIEEVVEADQNGVVVLSKGLKPNGSDFLWTIDQYSTDLALLNSEEFQISKRFRLQSQFQNDKYVFFYFENATTEYSIIRVNTETGVVSDIKGSRPKRSQGKVILTTEEIVYVYYNSSENNTCKIVDFETNTDKDFFVNAGRYKSDAVTLRSVSCDRNLDELVFLIEGKDQSGRHLIVSSYSLNGNIKQIADVGALSSNYLFGGEVVIVGSEKYLVSGSYALNSVSAPIGIYSTMFDGFEVAFYSETPLTSLQVFGKEVRDDSESSRKLRKVLQHIEVSNHQPMVSAEGYYILSEFCRSEYTSNVIVGVFFGFPAAMLSYQFNGYRYEGAAMLSFDWEGNLLWDVPLELSMEQRPKTQKLQINVEQDPKGFIIEHPYGEKMRTVLLSTAGNTETQFEEVNTSVDELNLWYDEFCLSHGTFYIYTVHNENSIENRVTTKREAYFIEKIAHH